MAVGGWDPWRVWVFEGVCVFEGLGDFCVFEGLQGISGRCIFEEFDDFSWDGSLARAEVVDTG